MFKIAVLGLVLLVAAGGPIAVCSFSEIRGRVSDAWSAMTGGSATPGDQALVLDAQPVEVGPDGLPAPSLEGAEVADLAEIFRFDVTTSWILGRWSRVSTGLGGIEFQGYRVPLVTGTAENDLAGSLTYYFTPARQLQRITFQGTTGDTRRLLQLLITRYGFARRVTDDPTVVVYQVPTFNGQTKSEIRIEAARIVKADQPLGRFHVSLVLQNPAKG
ncbi:MAG: hypothetical protein HQ581_28665 [Planctomycetes bacterium]|nr:hypothetical protein [Planctomycetota bacterium]